ncbi:MAG TPA: hypothetical protein VGG20_22605, partial [Thermoanaerobaculia bacterium]
MSVYKPKSTVRRATMVRDAPAKGGVTLFLFTWFVALLVLVGFACLAGRASGKGLLGILIDGRGRYSLNHLQI